MKLLHHLCLLGLVVGCLNLPRGARAADALVWDAKESHLSATVVDWPLAKLLDKISAKTGWQIYVEPGTVFIASAKFNNLPLGDALRSLLGNLSFALVPQTNAPARLYVFSTTLSAATQLIAAAVESAEASTPQRIPNELIVTVKPGVDIDALAKKLGAKVIGRVDGLNTYRLQFDSEEAAQAALASLKSNSDVASVDFNYTIGGPPPTQPLLASSAMNLNLQAKAIGEGGTVIVGLIDTSDQTENYCNLASFMLPTIKIAGDPLPSAKSPGHGPSMAETILRSVATTTGGKTGVKILPVDVYGPNATTTTFDVATGIYRAVNAGANPINLSLGSSGDSAFLHKVIQTATAQGVVIFAAAGNEPVTTPTYPAAYPEVVAVTAGDRRGNIASYANRGSFVDVVAPGGNVICYNGESWLVQGTSAATAFATGLAAGVADASGKTPGQVVADVRAALAKPATQP